MPVTFLPPARGEAPCSETYSTLESAVRAALGDTDEVVSVRFGCWTGDDGRTQYVCKVETPPAGPFGDEQWRWWSPLFEAPEELESALRDAVSRRGRSDAVRPGQPEAREPRSAAHASWGETS